MEWQPIETAPKDGTKIILFFPCYKDDPIDVYRYNDVTGDGFAWECIDGWGESDGSESPTHWMPLPKAPK